MVQRGAQGQRPGLEWVPQTLADSSRGAFQWIDDIDPRLPGRKPGQRDLNLTCGDIPPVAGTGGQNEDPFHVLVIGLVPPVNNLGITLKQEWKCYGCMTIRAFSRCEQIERRDAKTQNRLGSRWAVTGRIEHDDLPLHREGSRLGSTEDSDFDVGSRRSAQQLGDFAQF